MIVLVAGGTGFLGGEVVRELRAQGHRAVVYHRGMRSVPTRAHAIVNCVGIIKEDTETFKEAHVDITRFLLGLGRKLKVKQFVQVSALGVERASTPYQRTKRHAEELVMRSGLPYAIVRPSMMFGRGDRSINAFRKILRTGFFPLLSDAKVQPVSVRTVASLVVACAQRRVRDRVVEVAGPEVFTYETLAQRLHPGAITFRMPAPLTGVVTSLGAVTRSMPTRDMLTMLRQDATTRDRTVERLGIANPALA